MTAQICNQMYSGEKSVKTVWETHADALATILRTRGTASQFTDTRIDGITRASHRVAVRLACHRCKVPLPTNIYTQMFKNLLRRVTPGPETDMMEATMDPEVTWSQVIFAYNRIARLLPVADSIRAEAPSFASS